MKVRCQTSLDGPRVIEKWPTDLPAVPRVGDRIQSTVKHGHFQLELEVVSVTWKQQSSMAEDGFTWVPEIELHDPLKRSIIAFYDWYAPLVGRNPRSFC